MSTADEFIRRAARQITSIHRGDHSIVVTFARPVDRDDRYRELCHLLDIDPYPEEN